MPKRPVDPRRRGATLSKKIWFGGGEKSAHRSLLVSAGVRNFAVNLTHFPIPKKKELDFDSLFQGGSVLLYSGENDEDEHRYDDFLRQHSDALTVVIGRPGYDGEWLGEKYVPVWNDGDDLERLAFLCQRYGRAAISDKAVNTKTIGRIRSLSQRWQANLIGITSKVDVIEELPWDSVVVNSWTSAIRYGETQVFDGHGLRRYPAQQKESARKKHRSDIVRLGIDIDDVLNDDAQTLGILAIKSWLAWESKNMAYDPSGDDDEAEQFTSHNGEEVAIPANSGTQGLVDFGRGTIANTPVTKRHDSEKMLLPVMGVEQVTSIGTQTSSDEGEYTEVAPEEVSVLRYRDSSSRLCNSCYLASRCPAFKEDSDCAYKLPVEIRTKDQLQATLRAMLEMQTSRVLFARFAEELEGQGIDSQLSQEMERLFKLVEKFKDISDTREFVRMEIETRSGSGVLSRLFGSKVGEQSRELEAGMHLYQKDIDAIASPIFDADEV